MLGLVGKDQKWISDAKFTLIVDSPNKEFPRLFSAVMNSSSEQVGGLNVLSVCDESKLSSVSVVYNSSSTFWKIDASSAVREAVMLLVGNVCVPGPSTMSRPKYRLLRLFT